MKLLKLSLILALSFVTGIGALMLSPKPAAASTAAFDCPANHLRCFNGACTLAAPLWGCDDGSGTCVETWYGSYPACQT